MGFVLMTGACIGCSNLFDFNPNAVPSVRVNGAREPICRACVDRANPKRITNGLPPIEIQPGAYDSVDEESVIW